MGNVSPPEPKLKQKFLQFPLGLLAHGANEQDKFARILAFAQITAGQGIEAKIGRERAETSMGAATDIPQSHEAESVNNVKSFLGVWLARSTK